MVKEFTIQVPMCDKCGEIISDNDYIHAINTHETTFPYTDNTKKYFCKNCFKYYQREFKVPFDSVRNTDKNKANEIAQKFNLWFKAKTPPVPFEKVEVKYLLNMLKPAVKVKRDANVIYYCGNCGTSFGYMGVSMMVPFHHNREPEYCGVCGRKVKYYEG